MSSPCVWHVALSVPRDIVMPRGIVMPRVVMPRVSVTIRCHCVDFDLVPIYVFLFQFST